MEPGEQKLRDALASLKASAPPKLGGLAAWCLDHLDQIAFHSIRGLSKQAGVDANLVSRLARELGYSGFDPLRSEVQRIIQARGKSYGDRARALRKSKNTELYAAMVAASLHNFEQTTSPATIAQIDACIEPLLRARRIHSIGVRSCLSIAHYFAYVGSMAFDNFVQTPALPGAILDQMSGAGPEDIVVAITFEHYSAEVVRACQIARERGARVLALTDSPASPAAQGAWKSLVLPMAGPQLVPSLASAFLAAELILAAMAARSDDAAEKITDFEQRIAGFGGYFHS